MEPIIIREDLIAPNGTSAPLRIVVYGRPSKFIEYMHGFVSPATDYTWYIVAEVGMELTEEEFFGGPLAVFEGVLWTRHTMAEDYQPLVDELRAQVVAYLAERFPADGIRQDRFADWEPVIVVPNEVTDFNEAAYESKLTEQERLSLAKADVSEKAQTAFDLMNAGYEAAETERGLPLDAEQLGLLELAEYIADGLETGGIMLLTFEEAAFMDQVCEWDGLIVPLAQAAAVATAARLEEGGLVTITRRVDDIIVAAVRPTED